MAEAAPPARKQRSRAACKQCRQSKVKCGMDKVPCARCKHLRYDCEWDPSFKRAKTRDRFQELEKQVERLQKSTPMHLDLSASTQNGPDQTSSRFPQVVDAATARSLSIPADENNDHYIVLDLRLSFADAESLFKKFFRHYHANIPFLEPSRSPAVVYQQSELLFWSIISVAAREHQPYIDFLSRLSPYFAANLSDLAFGRRSSLSDIQAMVLLSLWPPSNVAFQGDKSLTLASLAVTEAMAAGLHNPSYEQEYTNKALAISDLDRSERTRTWMACVAVAQNHAMDIGLPLSLPFSSWTLQESCALITSTGVPSDLQHYLMIQKHAYSAMWALPERGNPDAEATFDHILADQVHSAVIELHERFDSISRNMSLLNRIRLAIVELHLYSMHLLTTPTAPHRTQNILKAYEIATTIITWYISEEGSSDILTYSPRTTFRSLLLVCAIVCTVLHSSYGAALDYTSGKVLFNAALLCFRAQAVQYRERKDLPLRCVEVLKGFWNLSENDPSLNSAPPELSIQTRQGAGVVHHAIALFFGRLALLRNNRISRSASLIPVSDFDALLVPDLAPLVDFSLDYEWDAFG